MKKYIIKKLPNREYLQVCSQTDINEGDEVAIEYTDGYKTTGEYLIGILTRKWVEDDGPYCAVDGKEIDLVSEGHSSNVYKILGYIYQEWVNEEMEFAENEMELNKADDSKKAKYLEEGDVIEENRGKLNRQGTIKSVELVEKEFNAVDWEDKFIITNATQLVVKNNEFIRESTPDFEITRGRVHALPKWTFECYAQCPNCKRFH